MDKMYTLKEIEEILHVTQRTLYNYIAANQIKAVKFGKKWLVSEVALNEFLEKGTDDNYLDNIKKESK